MFNVVVREVVMAGDAAMWVWRLLFCHTSSLSSTERHSISAAVT